MQIKGINTEWHNYAMAVELHIALAQSSLDLKAKKVATKSSKKSWPRLKGPRATRVDASTGQAVSFIR